MNIPLSLLALAFGLSATLAAAHPHDEADQQAMLTLGLDRADVTVVIVPSITGGADLVARIDADSDGQVSDAESAAFAEALAGQVRLTVDGAPVALSPTGLQLPPLADLAGGNAGVRLGLTAGLALAAGQDHQVALAISDHSLSGDWFIQPYYQPDFAARAEAPVIQRSPQGETVTVDFRLAE